MSLIFDSSAVIPLAMDDEASDYSAAAFDQLVVNGGLTTVLLWFEVRNALLVNERRGRITSDRVQEFLSDLDLLPLAYEPIPNSTDVLTLARVNKLTIYDAVYLELVLRTGFPLATLDADLARAVILAGGSLFKAS